MKFPKIDKILAQTLFWAIPVAAVIMLFLGLIPTILLSGIVIVFMAITIMWLAWDEAGEHV